LLDAKADALIVAAGLSQECVTLSDVDYADGLLKDFAFVHCYTPWVDSSWNPYR
jgi:hypothetical protein